MEKTALGEWLCLILLWTRACFYTLRGKGIKKKDGSELKLLTWKLILWAAICFLVTLLRSSELKGISGSWDSYNQIPGLKILGCMNRYFQGYPQAAWMITCLSLWTVDVEVCLKKQPCRSRGILLSQLCPCEMVMAIHKVSFASACDRLAAFGCGANLSEPLTYLSFYFCRI